MRLKDLYDKGRMLLTESDVPESDNDARFLLEYCFGIKSLDLILYPDKSTDKAGEERYMELIRKRATRYPLQYITGSQEFMGLNFIVNESVLIPRQDTEILVENVMKLCEGKDVLDMCTGSGCIIISLSVLSHLKSATAADISSEALKVAKKNADNNKVEISFIETDLFENIEGTFDVIVSNPPYIPPQVVDILMPEVKDYEPHLALEAPGDGTWFYEMIAKNSPKYLNQNGIIAFEIGYEQAELVSNILNDYGFADIRVIKDYAGLNRVVIAKRR